MPELSSWTVSAAGNNANPPDGWPEGMAPSEVNNTAREDRAVIRRWYNDHLWTDLDDTPTWVDATTFTVADDLTATYHFGRALKLYDSTGPNTWYGIITSSSYSSPDTTITVSLESGALNSDLDQVYTGIPANTVPQAFGNRPNKNFCWQGIFGLNPFQFGGSRTNPANAAQVADGVFITHDSDAAVNTSKDATVIPTILQAGYKSTASLKLDVTTADVSIAADQFYSILIPLEGYDWSQLAGKPVTFSFWFRATKTGTYCVGIKNLGSGSGSDRSFVREITVGTTNTWEKHAVTFDASPSAGTWNYANGLGATFFITLACGSNFQTTADAWQTGDYLATSSQVNSLDNTANNVYLEGIKIEEGLAATQIELATFGEVYTRALRYATKTFSAGATPVTNVGSVSGALAAYPNTTVVGALETRWQFPIPMRTTPTITTYNPTAANSGWRQGASTISADVLVPNDKSVIITSVDACASNVPAYIHLTAYAGFY